MKKLLCKLGFHNFEKYHVLSTVTLVGKYYIFFIPAFLECKRCNKLFMIEYLNIYKEVPTELKEDIISRSIKYGNVNIIFPTLKDCQNLNTIHKALIEQFGYIKH